MEGSCFLTLVSVVCREHPGVEAISQVVHIIQQFVAPPLSLPKIVESSSVHLFNVALHGEDQSSSVYYEKLRQYRLAMRLLPTKFTVEQGISKMIQQLYSRYPGALDFEAVKAVGKVGDLSLLEWLHTCEPKKFRRAAGLIFASASRNSRSDVVRWMVKLFPDVEFELEHAAEGGHIEQMEWLIENSRWNQLSIPKAIRAACIRGDLETAKFLHGFSVFPYGISVEKLAENGSRAVIKWLREVKSGKNWHRLPEEAAASGRLEILQWLHIKRIDGFSSFCMDRAATNGHLDVVKWLHANRREGCTSSALNKAAMNGHLEVLQWLHTNRTDRFGGHALNLAVKNKHLPVVRWLYEHGARPFDCAVKIGSLELVQWLHSSRHANFSKNAMDDAAADGYLDIVKFLHEKGSGCTRKSITEAAHNGHLELVKWLHAHYWKTVKAKTVNAAAANGHLALVHYLIENCSAECSSDAKVAAAANGHLYVLKFLASVKSSAWSEKAMKAAVVAGHVDIVKWIYFHFNEPFYPGCEIDAARTGNVDLLDFIRMNSTYCNNPVICNVAGGLGHTETVQWFRNHFGHPQKRRRKLLPCQGTLI